MDTLFVRRWMAGFWLTLALAAGIIAVLRFDAMLRQGPWYVTTGFEDISIFNFSRIRQGEPVYVDCFTYPYRMSLFNWLFYRFHATVVTVVDPSEEQLPTVLRLVTLGWTLAGFAGMLVFLRRSGSETGAWLTIDAASTAGLVLVTWLGLRVGWWSMTARPDVPAVVCELVALLLLIRGNDQSSIFRGIAAGLLFFLGWSFKQSFIGILAGTLPALLLWRAWSDGIAEMTSEPVPPFTILVRTLLAMFRLKTWKEVLAIAGTFVVLVGVVLVSAGRAYFANLFEAPALASFEFRQLKVVLWWSMLAWTPLLLVGVALLACMSAGARLNVLRSRTGFLLSSVFTITLVLNLAAARRPGSSGNYLFESWVVGMTLVGIIQQRAVIDLQSWPSPSHRVWFTGITGSILALSLLSVVPLFRLGTPEAGQPIELMVRLPGEPYSPELLDAVRDSARPMLCDDSFLVRLALESDAGAVPIVDHTIYKDAIDAGRLSRPDILERIGQHEYATLWLYRQQSWWQAAAKDAGYLPGREIGMFRGWTRPAK